jgi:hypothetical protein
MIEPSFVIANRPLNPPETGMGIGNGRKRVTAVAPLHLRIWKWRYLAENDRPKVE